MKNRMIKLATWSAVALVSGSMVLAGPPPKHDVVKSPSSAPPAAAKDDSPVSPLDFTVKSIDGKEQKLSEYKGKVVMLVNVASKCGFTPQYKQLEAVYKKYADQGLVILGFPANDFNSQEPGTDEEIKTFCSSKYNVTFPMMSKIVVRGDEKAPLYSFLTDPKANGDFGGEIGWNFTKFLVDRNGNVIARYSSQTKPDDASVTEEIDKALAMKPVSEKK